MGLPSQPVTLSVEQIGELNDKLATLRHDINNNLSLIIAALEVLRYKPHLAETMLATMSDQPSKITNRLNQFSAEIEMLLSVTR
jgi:hypothetical protein